MSDSSLTGRFPEKHDGNRIEAMQDGHATDEQLLRDHFAHRDEAAFGQLVQRHVNLVFGTALRILGNRTAAEEVAQNVFVSLARKAAAIRPDGGLAGWLHRAAILEARLRQRTDLRRLSREDQAAQLGTTMPTPESADPLPFEILDDALLELPEKDRRTLFLRYFENRPFREIAHTLGVGEDAAQKRTSRALEALAGILRRRGAPSATGALAGKTLEAAALTTAPAQLATSITSIALAAAGTAASSSALALLVAKLMALTNTQTAAVCLLLAAAPVGYQWHAASTLRQAVVESARELASTTNALARAESEAAAATRRSQATSTRLAETRALLRRANDQLATAAATLVTPALPDRGQAIGDNLRQTLTQLLGTERADLIWQQSEGTFESDFNHFGAGERFQTVAFHGPGSLSFWDAMYAADGKILSWNNRSGSLALETFPPRLRPIVAGWVTNAQPQRP
jgi:RNA polymerase sigma factor (sigma-70 family)